MFKYEVKIRQYDCHPETCCHDEHLPYWVVRTQKLHGHDLDKYLEGFDTRKEAEKHLESLK